MHVFAGMIPLKSMFVFEAAPRQMERLTAKDAPNNISSLIVTPDIKVRCAYATKWYSSTDLTLICNSWSVSLKALSLTLVC